MFFRRRSELPRARSELLRPAWGLGGVCLVLVALLATATPALAGGPEVRTQMRVQEGWRQILTVPFISQLGEPAPSSWTRRDTPYCGAAAALGVLKFFNVPVPAQAPLRTLFEAGRPGNTSSDPGLDPDGISLLFRSYGGEGKVHAYWNAQQALTELAGRINYGSPVVALTQGGNHAVTVYGYDADLGGSVTAVHVADPLSGFVGRVSVAAWQSAYLWSGQRFIAPGVKWAGAFVFVAYRDFAAPAPAPDLGGYHSRWLAQSAEVLPLARNASGQLTFSLRNSGSLVWAKGSASEVRLGVVGDVSSYAAGIGSAWPLANRVAAQDQDRVAPGEAATFTVSVRGLAPGVYRLPLRPVIDGLMWLEDEGIYSVVLVAGP